MTQFPAAIPAQRTQQLAENRDGLPVTVCAQEETRLGLQPGATVWPRFANFSLFGAVKPTPGDSFFLELPPLNSAMFPLWVDDFAHPFAASFNLLVLDNGAFQTANTLRWPPNVAAVPLPPYSPALHPSERLWRDLQDQLADTVAKTLDDLSATVCPLRQTYSQAALKR